MTGIFLNSQLCKRSVKEVLLLAVWISALMRQKKQTKEKNIPYSFPKSVCSLSSFKDIMHVSMQMAEPHFTQLP